jgi:hypothetical protein
MEPVRFKKIPLKLLIDTLTHLHDVGADYVDIVGISGETQDVVTISVEYEYMSRFDVEMPDVTHLINDKTLSDEDLNDLIQ